MLLKTISLTLHPIFSFEASGNCSSFSFAFCLYHARWRCHLRQIWLLFNIFVFNDDQTCQNAEWYNRYERMLTSYCRNRIKLSAVTQGAPSRPTSYLTLMPPSEWGLVNLKEIPRVSIPYRTRTRIACINVPDSSHHSTAPALSMV